MAKPQRNRAAAKLPRRSQIERRQDAQNKLMRAAIALLVDYAFRLRNLRRVWLTVHGRNARAIGAYRACGFVEEGRLRDHVWSDGAYDDLVYMAITRVI